MEYPSHTPIGQITAWLTESQVVEMLDVSLSKLRSDRQKVRGLSYVKFGRSVQY